MSRTSRTSRNHNLLGLAAPDFGSTRSEPSQSLIPFNPNLLPARQPTRQEERILDTLQSQTMEMLGFGMKTEVAVRQITQIHLRAAEAFSDTVGDILSIKAQAQGEEHALYVGAFTVQQVNALGRQLLGVAELGATSIARIVHSPLDVPPAQRSLWERLLGDG